jgi:hypothetical protein
MAEMGRSLGRGLPQFRDSLSRTRAGESNSHEQIASAGRSTRVARLVSPAVQRTRTDELDVPAVEALLVIGWALFLGTVIWGLRLESRTRRVTLA